MDGTQSSDRFVSKDGLYEFPLTSDLISFFNDAIRSESD